MTKLSDFAISESQLPTAINLYLLSKLGATEEDAQGRKQKFVFVHPARCTAANGWVSGWYFAALNGTNVAAAQFKLGSASTYWANDIEIPYGQGFGIFRTTVAATLVFSGAVAAEDKDISAVNASGYTWMGNVMPVAYKLKDFSINESQLPTAINFYLLSKLGATEEDAQGRKQKFVFVHPARCTVANGWVSGWYFAALNGTNVAAAEFKKGSSSAYWANEIEIPAGQGFGIFRTTVAATLKVPSPLVDHTTAE